jgi:hypothetical protein
LKIDLGALRLTVENEIDTYKYEVPEGAVGNAWPAVKVEAYLREMRTCLVDPYWGDVEIRDTIEQMAETEAAVRRCAVVFDPIEEEFLLASKQTGSLSSFGVRGDAVGCFMSI